MESADPSVPTWKIKSAYWAVRLFGSWPASKIEDNDEVPLDDLTEFPEKELLIASILEELNLF